MRSRSRMK